MASFRSVLQADGKTPHDGKDRVTQIVKIMGKKKFSSTTPAVFWQFCATAQPAIGCHFEAVHRALRRGYEYKTYACA